MGDSFPIKVSFVLQHVRALLLSLILRFSSLSFMVSAIFVFTASWSQNPHTQPSALYNLVLQIFCLTIAHNKAGTSAYFRAKGGCELFGADLLSERLAIEDREA